MPCMTMSRFDVVVLAEQAVADEGQLLRSTRQATCATA
jgi:hypothetical protein